MDVNQRNFPTAPTLGMQSAPSKTGQMLQAPHKLAPSVPLGLPKQGILAKLNRTLEQDAIWVMSDFAKLDAKQIGQLKARAYEHHKEYGAVVEALTGGIISAEEAMAMNPSGGLPGPGLKEIPLASKIGPTARHAMRHDALGFLFTRFEVGPGYGSKTTMFGLAKDNPLAGQILGIAREAIEAAFYLLRAMSPEPAGLMRAKGPNSCLLFPLGCG